MVISFAPLMATSHVSLSLRKARTFPWHVPLQVVGDRVDAVNTTYHHIRCLIYVFAHVGPHRVSQPMPQFLVCSFEYIEASCKGSLFDGECGNLAPGFQNPIHFVAASLKWNCHFYPFLWHLGHLRFSLRPTRWPAFQVDQTSKEADEEDPGFGGSHWWFCIAVSECLIFKFHDFKLLLCWDLSPSSQWRPLHTRRRKKGIKNFKLRVPRRWRNVGKSAVVAAFAELPRQIENASIFAAESEGVWSEKFWLKCT